MRYHTKEYYKLMMALGASDLYEPVIDKEYTDEEIKELYQTAREEYIEDERASYDEPPYLFEDIASGSLTDFQEVMIGIASDAYENRPPFDEEEAGEEFDEMYNDNMEEPDEDLPDWVREAVDPRILAMYKMPEKVYQKLAAEDEVNEARFDELDDAADEALEANAEALPPEYAEFLEKLDDLEDSYIVSSLIQEGNIELGVEDWGDEGSEIKILKFEAAEIIENEGVEAHSGYDEDGDIESDCELLYSELYQEDGKYEIHMLFDNNGLKYLTFRCTGACILEA